MRCTGSTPCRAGDLPEYVLRSYVVPPSADRDPSATCPDPEFSFRVVRGPTRCRRRQRYCSPCMDSSSQARIIGTIVGQASSCRSTPWILLAHPPRSRPCEASHAVCLSCRPAAPRRTAGGRRRGKSYTSPRSALTIGEKDSLRCHQSEQQSAACCIRIGVHIVQSYGVPAAGLLSSAVRRRLSVTNATGIGLFEDRATLNLLRMESGCSQLKGGGTRT